MQVGCHVTVVPGTAPAAEVLRHKPDGIFLSNGPGDPEPLGYAINTIRELIGKKPIFGICLGHQLLGLALGGKTFTGKVAIHDVFAKAAPFQAENNWISDTAAYRIRVSVNGDKGTLSFECHFIDAGDGPTNGEVAAVTAGDADVARIDGKWLITNFVGGTTEL